MNKEPRTMQVADAVTASRAPENTPAMVKKIGKTTYKVHVHFSNTSPYQIIQGTDGNIRISTIQTLSERL